MAKPTDISNFTRELEYLLIQAWRTRGDKLPDNFIKRTREAVSEIREFYTFKRRMPKKIRYRTNKHRAGYLASFGQRHAYLPYYQLKEVEKGCPKAIPSPYRNSELTIILTGAGAAIELFGVLFYYNESVQRVRKVHLITIEKVGEWEEIRSLVTKSMLKSFFPKVVIKEYPIVADLTKPCWEMFARIHETLISCDILMCYNVLNENEVKVQDKIIANIRYVVSQNTRDLLVLLMEPAPDKAIPRVRPFKQFLAQHGTIIQDHIKTYVFDKPPLKIELESEEDGLNRMLFSRKAHGKSNPIFEQRIKRNALTVLKKTNEVLPLQEATAQHREVRDREKGYYVKRRENKNQMSFRFGNTSVLG